MVYGVLKMYPDTAVTIAADHYHLCCLVQVSRIEIDMSVLHFKFCSFKSSKASCVTIIYLCKGSVLFKSGEVYDI